MGVDLAKVDLTCATHLTRHASARDIYRGCIHLDYLQSVCVLVCVDGRRLAKGTNSWGVPGWWCSVNATSQRSACLGLTAIVP